MYISISVVLWFFAWLWGAVGTQMGVITPRSNRWPDWVLGALVLSSIVTFLIGFTKLSLQWLA